MLRTNPTILSFVEQLYQGGQYQEDISLRRFDKGRLLLQQGNPCTRVYIIKAGITKCFFSESNDKDYIVEFLSVGEILGEIEAIKGMPCLCSIEALTAVEAYAITIPFLQSLLRTDLAFCRILIDEMAERIINTATRSSFQQLHTIEHALRKMLELQQKQNLKLSKEDMAAYLGVTLRSLNRALKSLSEAGLP